MSNTKLTLLVSGLIVVGLLAGVALGSGDSAPTKTVTVAHTVTTFDTVTRTATVIHVRTKVRYKTRVKVRYRTVTEPSTAGYAGAGSSSSSSDSGCSDEYSGACVPTDQGDVNCGDLSATDFQSTGSDPYRLDADGDGVACES